jgi:hypothetical protein
MNTSKKLWKDPMIGTLEKQPEVIKYGDIKENITKIEWNTTD